MNRSTKAIGFTAAAAAVTFTATSMPAAFAGTSAITVTTTTTPVWLSNSSMPIAFTVVGQPALNFCGPFAITLSWKSAGDAVHHQTMRDAALAGVQSGTLTIPGSTVWPGTLRYRVTARQRCIGGRHASQVEVAQSPAAGWSKTTIK